MKKWIFIFTFITLIGCATTTTVSTSSDNEAINTLTMSCSSPYALTQDCSIWSGATRTVYIRGFEVKVAASKDGKVILVMDANIIKNTLFDNPFTFNSKTHSDASNSSYHAIRTILDKNSIGVTKVRPLKLLGNVDGYILELTSDGYSLLIPLTQN